MLIRWSSKDKQLQIYIKSISLDDSSSQWQVQVDHHRQLELVVENWEELNFYSSSIMKYGHQIDSRGLSRELIYLLRYVNLSKLASPCQSDQQTWKMQRNDTLSKNWWLKYHLALFQLSKTVHWSTTTEKHEVGHGLHTQNLLFLNLSAKSHNLYEGSWWYYWRLERDSSGKIIEEK